MILKRLEIQGYGPFLLPTVIEIDENVTILSGQNDVGKSSVLRLIQLIYGKLSANQDDQNVDRREGSKTAWQNDEGVLCKATYLLDQNWSQYFADPHLNPNDEVDVLYRIITGHKGLISIRRGVNKLETAINNPSLRRMPEVLYFAGQNEIRSSFDFATANDLEKYLLLLAFGDNAEEKLLSLTDYNRAVSIEKGNQALRAKLSSLFPSSMGLIFYVALISQEPLRFAISFGDKHGGVTPILQRGTGIRKIVSILIALAQAERANNKMFILIDEPENSLHADSQHRLRAFLEALAVNDHIQVIYATHSPSMINTLNCKGLRLLERSMTPEDRATSKVINDPYRDNFYPVRISLGLNPSDSLLYAPITVVTEGSTELLSVPYILKKLHDEHIEGFEEVDNLLPLTHFVSGQGNDFERWCRMANSQGSKPIVFVDGEKYRRVKGAEFQRNNPNVPVVHLDQNLEFEDLVAKEVYLRALSNDIQASVTLEEFEEWNKASGIRNEVLFTKRIQPFLNDKFPSAYYDKPVVMRKALESAAISEINLDYFRELMTVISDQARRI